MEPMTLGSAPSSPTSATSIPSFLPNFLMGDNMQSMQSTNNFNISPGRNKPPSRVSAMQDATWAFSPRSFNQSVEVSGSQVFTPHKSGPPNQGLFDTIDHVRRGTPHSLVELPSPLSRSKSASRIDDSISNTKFDSRTTFSRHGQIDTQWVTVFGFPSGALSLVLARLSNCGTIVEKKVPPQGNWMHLKFSNVNEVANALALNGRCLDQQTMIGVKLYYPKENKENDGFIAYSTPIRARSLRQSYISPNTPNSVLPPQNVPQKSTGLVSKAMEYVFGW